MKTSARLILGLILHLSLISSQVKGQSVTFTSPFIINCLARESHFLWIGSMGGLTKMDLNTGNKTVYNCSNSPIVANNITALLIDNAGNKWVGCQDAAGGLYKFDGYNWTDYTIIPGVDTLFNVRKIIQDIFGRIIALDPAYQGFVEIIDSNLITTFHSNQFPLPNTTLIDLVTDSLGNFWFSTNKGVMYYDSLTWTIFDTSNVSSDFIGINELDIDQNGVVWATNVNYNQNKYNIFHYDGSAWIYDTSFIANNTNKCSIFIDSKNIKYFYSSQTPIMCFNDVAWSLFNGSACVGNVMTLLVDSSDNSFSAKYYRDSIDYYDNNSCQALSSTNFSFTDIYFESVTIGDDNLVYATTREGLYQTNGVWINRIPTPSQISNFRKIRFDHYGNLWLISYDSQTFLSHLAKWDGVTWIVYPYSYDFEDLAVAPNGDVWFGTRNGLLKYDGVSFQNYVFNSPSSTSKFVNNLSIDTAGNVWFSCDDYGKFDGNSYTWYNESTHTFLYEYPHYIHADSKGNVWFYNGNWNVAGDLIKYDGNNWTFYNSSNSNWPDSCEFISFQEDNDGNLWFGTIRGLIKYDGIDFTLYDNLQYHMGYYPVRDFAQDNEGNFWCADLMNLCVFNPNGMYHLELEPKSEISGSVYFDSNSNGVYDSVEVGIPNMKILMEPDSIYRLTNSKGGYKFNSDSSSCKVSFIPPAGYSITSDSVLFHVNIDSTLNCCYDFGVFPNQLIHDLELSMVVLDSRCFRPMISWLNISNRGTALEDFTAWFLPDSQTLFLNSVPPPSFISGDTLSWNIVNFAPYNNSLITISLMPDNSVLFPSDSLAFYSGLTNLSGTLTFEADSSMLEYRCSRDPNDKTVIPQGDSLYHAVVIQDTLEYTIRFQNTGNDTAYSVFIYDTLDPNLDINTFEFIASSHEADIKYDAKGRTRFAFYSIMLPDSHVNELGSQGFIRYRIRPKQYLQDSTIVFNTSYIYFDFNNPIQTNTVYNTLLNPGAGISKTEKLKDDLFLYPNPVQHQQLFIDFKYAPERPIQFQLYDISGRSVFSTSLNLKKSNTVVLPLIESGLYSCLITIGTKQYFRKLVVM